MGKVNTNPSNQVYLLIILVLDVAAFSIIFPLIPAILKHYIGKADQHSLDFWLPSLVAHIDALLPEGYSSPENRILLIGGFLSVCYSLVLFLSAPYWGRFSDRFGRKITLLLSSLGSILYGVIWFFADSFSFFCLARLFSALMGGNLGVASASMADMSSPEKRTSAMGLIGAAFGLGFLLGPLLGALSVGWKLELGAIHPFLGPALISTAFSLASVLANAFKFQESLKASQRRASPWILNPFASLKELPEKSYRYLVLAYSIYFFLFSAYEFSFSFYYSLEFKLNSREIGLMFFYVGCLHVLGQGMLVRILSSKLAPHLLLYTGLAIQPIPLFFFAFDSSLLWLSMILLIPISLGAALNTASLAGLASLTLDIQKQGYGLSLLRSFASLSRALAPLSLAPLYWLAGAKVTYMTLGILFSLLLLCLYLSKKIIPAHAVYSNSSRKEPPEQSS